MLSHRRRNSGCSRRRPAQILEFVLHERFDEFNDAPLVETLLEAELFGSNGVSSPK
jgi:hypothetical protein